MNPKDGRGIKPPTIAVVGFSARAATQCAKEDGFSVVSIDMCADRDLLSECELHLRLDNPDWPTVLYERFPDCTLLLAGGMEFRTDLVDRCQRMARRLGISATQISSMRRLEEWEDWANASGIGWPQTFRNPKDALPSFGNDQNRRWLQKSLGGAGGAGVVEIADVSAFPSAETYERSKVYIQERLPGESIGVTFLGSEFGCVVVGAAAAWPMDAESQSRKFVYRGSVGPIVLDKQVAEKLEQFADAVFQSTGIHGLWQADFLLHHNVLTLLEINPRWSASMELLDCALNLCLVKMHHAATDLGLSKSSVDEFRIRCLKLLTEQRTMIGKLIAYADHPMVVSSAQSDYWWSKRWKRGLQLVDYQPLFADIPPPNTSLAEGDPILTVLTTGKTQKSILEVLQKAKSSEVFR